MERENIIFELDVILGMISQLRKMSFNVHKINFNGGLLCR